MRIVTKNMSELDFDDRESIDFNDERESDEDTEDASETDMLKYDGEYTEIKEQMYHDKLATLKDQLMQLESGTHPEYARKIRKLQQFYDDRVILTESFLYFETERIEREYISEKRSSVREFEERKIELKENLLSELEEKKKMIESERITLELTNDSTEPKPITTRKLRRRPNEPIPIPEKRRRASPAQLNLLLDENDILEDLKALSRACNVKLSTGTNHTKKVNQFDYDDLPPLYDARIEDGKLFYDKKWFHRGQNILIESSDSKFSAILVQIGGSEVFVKKINDQMKSKITLYDLQSGTFVLYRRAS